MAWSHWSCWHSLTVLFAIIGFSSCVGDHPEVHGGPARASNVCQECHRQEQLRDDTDIWHTWQEKPGPVEEWQPKYGETSKLCLCFHLLSLVFVLFYQEWEKQRNSFMLLYLECHKCKSPGRTLSSFWQEKKKQKHLHLSIFLSLMNHSCCALIRFPIMVMCIAERRQKG